MCAKALRVYDSSTDYPGGTYGASVAACCKACGSQKSPTSGSWGTFGLADSSGVGTAKYNNGQSMGRCYCTKAATSQIDKGYKEKYDTYTIKACPCIRYVLWFDFHIWWLTHKTPPPRITRFNFHCNSRPYILYLSYHFG